MYENSFTLKKMVTAYAKPLRFSGRSTRTELLGYIIISWLASTLISWLAIGAGMVGSIDLGFASFSVANFLLWLPFPALSVRRFHDENRPGWWTLPLVIPTILVWLGGTTLLHGPVLIIVDLFYAAALILLFWKPTDGVNSYGPDPRLDAEEAAFAHE